MPSFSSESPPDPEKVCQTCGTRPATSHVCQIIHGQQATLDLCDVCLRSSMSLIAQGLASLIGARCFYCGTKSADARLNQAWEFASRQQRFHHACLRCTQLGGGFLIEAVSRLPADLPSQEQWQCLEQITRDVDARVRASVRGGGG